MAAYTPFQPKVISSLAGFTQVVTSAAIATISGVSVPIPTVLVTNLGQAVFVRLDPGGASGSAASATDTPLAPNAVRLFTNPKPNGVLGIAIMGITVSNSLVFVTPGDGGVD